MRHLAWAAASPQVSTASRACFDTMYLGEDVSDEARDERSEVLISMLHIAENEIKVCPPALCPHGIKSHAPAPPSAV